MKADEKKGFTAMVTVCSGTSILDVPFILYDSSKLKYDIRITRIY